MEEVRFEESETLKDTVDFNDGINNDLIRAHENYLSGVEFVSHAPLRANKSSDKGKEEPDENDLQIHRAKQDALTNEEKKRLTRSDQMIDIVASSIIRISNTVPNSECDREYVMINGKTYHIITDGDSRQQEMGAKLTQELRHCINPNMLDLGPEKKPILMINPQDDKDCYVYFPILTADRFTVRGIYIKVDKKRKVEQPIGCFVTASCFFGSQTLIGVDKDGKRYSLLDSKNPIPAGVHIIKVESLNDSHIYERAMLEAYKIIANLINDHENARPENGRPQVMHLLADFEYYLYGLTYLVGGVFNADAFKQYISEVNFRAAKHRDAILKIYEKNGIDVKFNVNSPFRNLDLRGKSADDVIGLFVRLFAENGVNTIEDLAGKINQEKITLTDLLIKLKESFSSDPEIAILRADNNKNQKIIRSKKKEVTSRKLDSNHDVLTVLDEVGQAQCAANKVLQEARDPWRLDKFEVMLHDILRGKEKNPTPSQMFSIVSRISEVARVVMSVNQSPNKPVCVIFEGQQIKTLKLFKKHFSAHAQKICAYVYQLPIATLGRPLYHEADCPAVREDLLLYVSTLYCLSEKDYNELNCLVGEYLTFNNCRYDSPLLEYLRVGGWDDKTRRINFSAINEKLWSLLDNSILLAMIDIGLSEDNNGILHQQLCAVVIRLARHIMFRTCSDSPDFGSAYLFSYAENPNSSYDDINCRNLWCFRSEDPILTKEQRVAFLSHLLLLEKVGESSSDSSLKFQFCSAIMLTYLSSIIWKKDTDYDVCLRGSHLSLMPKYFESYISLVLLYKSYCKSMSIEGFLKHFFSKQSFEFEENVPVDISKNFDFYCATLLDIVETCCFHEDTIKLIQMYRDRISVDISFLNFLPPMFFKVELVVFFLCRTYSRIEYYDIPAEYYSIHEELHALVMNEGRSIERFDQMNDIKNKGFRFFANKKPHILNEDMQCKTFLKLKDQPGLEPDILEPDQALVGICFDEKDHAALYVQFFDKKCNVIFYIIEITTEKYKKDKVNIVPKGYCALYKIKTVTSKSNSKPHMILAIKELVKHKKLHIKQYAPGVEEIKRSWDANDLFYRIRDFRIMSGNQFQNMLKSIQQGFQTEKGEELFWPFFRGGMSDKFRYDTRILISGQPYGEAVRRINCLSFCRMAMKWSGLINVPKPYLAGLFNIPYLFAGNSKFITPSEERNDEPSDIPGMGN